MKTIGYLSIGFITGATVTALTIYVQVGHFREPTHQRRMGHLKAESEIINRLRGHFGTGGKFPGSTVQSIPRPKDESTLLGIKSTQVIAAEKDGVPTLYITPE